MRTIVALASLTLLVAAGSGCGDDTTSGGVDMTMGADLSVVVPHDMATLSCAMTLSCVQGCSGSASCQVACIGAASTTAKTKFGAFAGCLFAVCGPVDGGGSGMCTGVNDTSGGCQACIGQAGQAAVTGTAATPCHNQYADCAAN